MALVADRTRPYGGDLVVEAPARPTRPRRPFWKEKPAFKHFIYARDDKSEDET